MEKFHIGTADDELEGRADSLARIADNCQMQLVRGRQWCGTGGDNAFATLGADAAFLWPLRLPVLLSDQSLCQHNRLLCGS